MGKLVNYITSLHTSTKRNYIDRMNDDKVKCMITAKKYSKEYWDGDRRYGYGGYNYIPGRWKKVAESLIKNYKLSNDSSILDVGCGKAFLLFELKTLLPDLKICGLDSSKYAIENSKKEIKNHLIVHNAKDKYPFEDNKFDLVISLNTLHNLKIFE